MPSNCRKSYLRIVSNIFLSSLMIFLLACNQSPVLDYHQEYSTHETDSAFSFFYQKSGPTHLREDLVIGVSISDLDDPIIADIIKKINQFAETNAINLVTTDAQGSARLQKSQIQEINQADIDILVQRSFNTFTIN